MTEKHVPHRWKPRKKTAKTLVVRASFFLVGRALEAAAILDKDVKAEVAQWKDPITFLFQVLPNGPFMVLKKEDGVLRYAGSDPVEADMTLYFKNIESAFLIFSGQMGAPHGSAEHRVALKGDASQAMSFIRCLENVQAHLFPAVIAKRVLKDTPRLTLRRAAVRAGIYGLGIPLGLGRFAGRKA